MVPKSQRHTTHLNPDHSKDLGMTTMLVLPPRGFPAIYLCFSISIKKMNECQ